MAILLDILFHYGHFYLKIHFKTFLFYISVFPKPWPLLTRILNIVAGQGGDLFNGIY